jgi:hypothetical protein
VTITEANAVNTLLRYVLGSPPGGDPQEAAAHLADKAHRALSAGLTGADVRAAWDLNNVEILRRIEAQS